MRILLNEGIRGQVHTPQEKAEEQEPDSDKLPPFAQPIKTQPREDARYTNKREDRKLDEKRILHEFGAYVAPRQQEGHEQPKQKLAHRNFEEVQAAPQEENRGDADTPLPQDVNELTWVRIERGDAQGQPQRVEQ